MKSNFVIYRKYFAVATLACAALLLAARAHAHETASVPEPTTIEVPGYGEAFYYKPRSKSRRRIILYVHGRGANASEDCRKWPPVAPHFGWAGSPPGPA